jgi:hypothetical protein
MLAAALGVHGRTGVDPRLSLFDLSGDAEQEIFAIGRADKLHADR